MSIHKLTEDGKSKLKQDYIKKIAISIIAGLLPFIFLIYASTVGSNPNKYLFMVIEILFILSSIALISFFAARIAIKSIISLQITFDDNRVTQSNTGRPEVTINREEVASINEIENKGIILKSIISSESIFLPCGLENYEILKTNLALWQPRLDGRVSKYRSIIIALLACLIFVVYYKTKSQMFAWIFIVFYLVTIVLQFIENKKHPKRMIGRLDSMVIGLGGIIFITIVLTMFFKK
jgi:hypothetical protein